MSNQSDTHTLFWVPRFWPAVGGTEFHSHELARNLAQSQRVTVLTHCTATETASEPLSRLAAKAKSEVTHFGNLRVVTLAPSLQYATSLGLLAQHNIGGVRRRAYCYCFDRAFRQQAQAYVAEADRIHFIYNGLTSAATLAVELARDYDIPFVFTPNVLDTTDSSAWAAWSFREIYTEATHLIALTTHEKRWLQSQGTPEHKISVVPYGPILQSPSPSDESSAIKQVRSTRYILFLGRVVPEKGYRKLLNAFISMQSHDADLHLVFVGPADASVRSLIDSGNNQLDQARIHLFSDITQPEKTALLESAAVLCVPSSCESLGGVYIEAMACSTPVIALDRPVSRCVIDHEKDGLLVNDNQASLVSALSRLLRDPQLASRLGAAGHEKVKKRFAWPEVTTQIRAVYQRADNAHTRLLAKAG